MGNTSWLVGGIVLGGAVFGAGAWFCTRRYYMNKIDETVKQMSDAIEAIDPYSPNSVTNGAFKPTVASADIISINDINTGDKIDPKDLEDMSAKAYSDVSRAAREIQKEKTDYQKFYTDVDVPEGGPVKMDDLLRDVKKEDEDDDDEHEPGPDDIHSKSDLYSDPVIVSDTEAGELPDSYTSETIYYYTKNDVVVDDFDEVIDDPGMILGNLLETSGFKKDLKSFLYVKNPRMSVVYCIQKVFEEWTGGGPKDG